MSQRAITQELLALALSFGTENHDGRVLLDRRGLLELMESLNALRQAAQRALNKGGLVVVREGDSLITTYPLG